VATGTGKKEEAQEQNLAAHPMEGQHRRR